MTTIRQLITGAMRLNRVVATNEVPSDADIRVGQEALVGMLDNMQADLLNIFTTTPRRFLLTPGKQAYTLGPAVAANGDLTNVDWATERPVRVERAVLLQNPSVVVAQAPAPPTPPPPPFGPGYGFYINATNGPGDGPSYNVEALTDGFYEQILQSSLATAATATLWNTQAIPNPFYTDFPIDVGSWTAVSAQAINADSGNAVLSAQGLQPEDDSVVVQVAASDSHTCQILLPSAVGGQLFFNSQQPDGPEYQFQNFTVLDSNGSRVYRITAPLAGTSNPTFVLSRLM